MASVFIIRHQAHGYLNQFAFASQPTDEQMATARKLCERLHGTHHPKVRESGDELTSDNQYWMRVEELPVLSSSDELPTPHVGNGSSENVAALRPFGVTGTGTVTPQK